MASSVVLVVVLSSDAQTTSTQAMLGAARSALGGATVIVREVPAAPSDESALKAGKAAHADAVVVVTWPDAGAQAHLHVRVLTQAQWADRDLVFGSGDVASERGRSAGLALATMVPAETAEPAPVAPPVAVTPLPPPKDPPTPIRPKPGTKPRALLELDAAALGTVGFVGTAGAAGGELALRLVVPELVTFRLGGGVRFGDLEEIEGGSDNEASTATTRATVGVVVHAARTRALELGIGVDAGVVHHSVSRINTEGSRETHGRFVGAGDVVLDCAWWFDRVALFGAAGVELALGETRVIVGSRTATTIPPARGLLILGVRMRL